MAIGVTKVHGDSAGVVNVDAGRSVANAVIINTGINAPISTHLLSFAAGAGTLKDELQRGGNGTDGAVETLLKNIASNATVVAYQVDAGTSGAQQLSVLVERSSWDNTTLQTNLRTLGNIGAYGNVYCGTAQLTVTSPGLKLA